MSVATTEDDHGEQYGRASAWAVLIAVMDLFTPMAVRVAGSLGLADLMAGDAVPVEEPAHRSET